MATQKIKIGDVVRDSYNRLGVVMGKADYPEDFWLEEQEDEKLHKYVGSKKYDVLWLTIYPLDGGAVVDCITNVKRIRKANKKDLKMAYKNANYFARKGLELL